MSQSNGDQRFARLKTDPRFRRPKQKKLQVEIDERFRDVLEGEEFGGKGKGKGKGKVTDSKSSFITSPQSRRRTSSNVVARVDKRGRPLTSSHHQDQLKRFYRLRSPDTEAGPSGEAGFIDYARGEGALSSSGSEDESGDEDSDVSDEELELGGKRRVVLPGDETSDESDSESSSSSESHIRVDLSENEEIPLGEAEAEDEGEEADEEEEGPTTDPTTRIAAVNLDWDNLRAVDLFAVFNSFLKAASGKKGGPSPAGNGRLVNVRIYPSEFGKERMKKEELEGPGGGIFIAKPGAKRQGGKGKGRRQGEIAIHGEESDEEETEVSDGEMDDLDGSDDASEDPADLHDLSGDDDEEEGSEASEERDDASVGSDDDDVEELPPNGLDGVLDGEIDAMSDAVSDAGSEEIDMTQLRQYQLERLRYYYAVATFSTVAAAEYVMDECDGTEFERTANVFDLSYVPEGMEFDEDEMSDEAIKEPRGYKGTDFVTDALRHSKVKLTWDQDDPNRSKLTRKALTREEIEEQDFKNLVAGSDDDADSESDDADGDDAPSGTKQAGIQELGAKEKKSKKALAKERKDKLRAMLLKGDDEDGDIWGKAGRSGGINDASDDEEVQKGGMEITFKSALSGNVDDLADDNLTSLERYQLRMKEKKSRKKEKIELKRAAKDEDEPVEKADEFFGDDSDGDGDALAPAPPAKAKAARAAKATEEEDEEEEEDLHANLNGGIDKEHFSMKDILKEEKSGGKKRNRRKSSQAKKEARAEALGRAREVELGKEGWKIDVKDPRFKALHEEADFAIDPSNPAFQKTKAMQDLLAERTRVRNANSSNRFSVQTPSTTDRMAKQPVGGKERDLTSLVKSVKRAAEGQQANGGDGRKKRRR